MKHGGNVTFTAADSIAAEAEAIAGQRLDRDVSLLNQGFNSIALIRLLSSLEDKHDVQIDLGTLFESPTINDIVKRGLL